MEDVQHIKKYGVEESFLFMVDSSTRNIDAYSSPSEYAIEFNVPFRHVIGVDLVDAIIPRSEYIIDTYSNSFVYSVNSGTKKVAIIQPGDYNLIQLCTALNSVLQDGLAVEPHSTPYQVTSKIRMFCTLPFVFYAAESTMKHQIGFHTNQATYEAGATGRVGQRSFLGPFPGFATFKLNSTNYLRQAFSPVLSGTVSSVIVQADESSQPIAVRILDAAGTVYATASIAPSVTSEGYVTNASLPLLGGGTYYMEMRSTGGAEVYINPSEAPSAETAPTIVGPWAVVGDDTACIEVWVNVVRYEIESPGLVDLTGLRYVLVRCPEIESILHRERAFDKYHAGLGMVKLGMNGYQEHRFDFVSFPPRKLQTPLGKMSQLTFRLERPDGSLYNSRGIDHALLLAVRYYSILMEPRMVAHESRLNPDYTPNVREHMERRWKEDVEDRDALSVWQAKTGYIR